MATFENRGGRWRAQVCIAGKRASKTFPTKAAAKMWAAEQEVARDTTKTLAPPRATFGDLLIRYRDNVSTTKAGVRWETVRINRILRTDPLAKVMLENISQPDIAAWRDRRLKQVGAGSVLRDWTLLSAACTTAVKEWRWLDESPMKGVKRPPTPESRDRRITESEIERLCFAAGYSRDEPPTTQTARVGAALLFAIETAMRAGEIVALRWSDVELDRRFLRVAGHAGGKKTAAAKRDVPLSTEALRILDQLAPVTNPICHDNSDLSDKSADKCDLSGSVFRITSAQSLDALFRKMKARTLIDDLHFHDSRHEAITRLAKRLDVLALARMVGHRDLRQLQIYYNETAEELAGMLE